MHYLVDAEQQARHALAEDEHLEVVGCIAAVGNVWRYGEVDCFRGGFQNTGRDSTYTPRSSSGTPSTEASPLNLRTPRNILAHLKPSPLFNSSSPRRTVET